MAFTIQRANTWKRISAYLFDFILAIIVTVGIATVLSAALGYNKKTERLNAYRDEYIAKYEALYPDVDLDISEEDYNKLSAPEKETYDQVANECRKATNGDERVKKLLATMFFNVLVIVSISVLLGIIAVQFAVPLFFKNGQTLGKKIFGVAVARSNCVKISNFVLFVRAVFGLYAIETMFPIFLYIMMYFGILGGIGSITILLLLILQLGLLLFTRNHTCIHDLLSDTITVDMASQRIFDTQEEADAFFKAQKEEEEAQKKDYI